MNYRIITNGQNEFKVQYRWLFWWRIHKYLDFDGWHDVIFLSYESAYYQIEKWKKEDEYNSLKWFSIHEE